jgi:pimeloyl-ACP methyl ester carboxylesterase
MVTRPQLALVGLALVMFLAFEQWFEHWFAHKMVDAPNQGAPTTTLRPREMRVHVGPPDADLSIEIVAPKLPPRATLFVLPGISDDKEYLRSYAEHLATAGYRAILVDTRGHGRSSGQWLGWGLQESRDLSQLIDKLKLDGPLGVLGHSYGGATAIIWASREPRLRAVLSLGPFASMRDCIDDLPGVHVLVPRWLRQRIVDIAGRLGHFDPDEASALAAVRKTQTQMLVVHGTADPLVPYAQSQRLAAAAPDHVKLVLLDGQNHEDLAGDPRLWPITLEFLARMFP